MFQWQSSSNPMFRRQKNYKVSKWKLKKLKHTYKTLTVLIPILHFNGPCHCTLKKQTTNVHFFETRRDLTFQSRNIEKNYPINIQ